MKFYKKTFFWMRVRDSLAMLGPTGGILIGEFANTPWAIGISISSALIVGWIAIWFVDNDKDGFVDLFEEDEIETK